MLLWRFGWQLRDGPHGKVIFKDGALPGYASYMVFVPAQGTGVVLWSAFTLASGFATMSSGGGTYNRKIDVQVRFAF